MKKKIKDLTPEERKKVCIHFINNGGCRYCPFYQRYIGELNTFCIISILDILEEGEVEVDESNND